jgi:L-lactate dehydrogenase complex protein LldF
MKTYQSIDAYSRDLSSEIRESVYSASKAKYDKRLSALQSSFDEPDTLRKLAGQIKQHTLENLPTYLDSAIRKLETNGAKVHFAKTGDEANATILGIMQAAGAKRMIKSKSMVSEEIHLNAYLEKHGCESIESDLGEFIVQLDEDTPSHIVTPIIHKNRIQVATTFENKGLGDYNDDPQTITRRAREYLRQKYMDADVGLTGANFISAESGRIALVTNEGNARFSICANRIHIVLVGIEKVIPRDKDLALFLNLLSRSATGQQLTVYTQLINGPKAARQPDGPEQMHVVFLDNGRSDILGGEFRSILRCIRCGACLNVCPIYRQSSGHAYRAIYPGPVGAVLSPLLAGKKYSEFSDLPKASSLCGACNEVCPVDIPLPELLLRHRNKAKKEHFKKAAAGTPPLGAWAQLCSTPLLWKTTLATGKAMDYIPMKLLPIPAIQAWTETRALPPFEGGKFRKWFKQHQK